MSHSFGKPFSKNSLNLPKVALLGLAIAITGCNSNSTEAKQSKPVTSKNTTTASAESDPAVVNAIQANLKASGIEQKIISAVPTSMENMYCSNICLNLSYEPMPGFIIFESTFCSECSGAIFR
jgi:thiol:disulfide interchange protein DsbC